MKITKKKFFISSILGILIMSVLVLFFLSPKGRALLKSKRHLIVYKEDSRILYEPGAEEYASKIAEFLSAAIERVERGHFLPFKKPFKVYVFNTQKSHNVFIGNPTSYPIRGTALLGNVYIAPSAFSFKGIDTHRESLMHELSHLHLAQRLGFFKRRRIPYWFTEGLANFIAGSGGEGISKGMAIQAIKEGRHIILQEGGGVFKTLTQIIQEAGISGPMYHKQNRMFMNFIHSLDPGAFDALVLAVQNGKTFSTSFAHQFKISPQEMWDRFISELLRQEETENRSL